RTVPRPPYRVRPGTVRPVTAPMGKGPYWVPVPRDTASNPLHPRSNCATRTKHRTARYGTAPGQKAYFGPYHFCSTVYAPVLSKRYVILLLIFTCFFLPTLSEYPFPTLLFDHLFV